MLGVDNLEAFNATKEFQYAMGEYLILLSKKAKQAEVNEAAANELAVLDHAYNMMAALAQKCDQELAAARIQIYLERFAGKVLEGELRKAYNHVYQVSPGRLAEIMKTTALPSKKELEQPVKLK